MIIVFEKCIDYIEKWPFMVIFLFNLYILLTNLQFYFDQ